MAIAYVGEIGTVTKDPAGTTSVITVGASGVTAGNHIILLGTLQGTNSVSSVTDSVGNTYTIDRQHSSAGLAPVAVCSAHVSTGLVNGNTITITHSSSVGAWLAEEFSGIVSASYVDGVASAGAVSNAAVDTGSTATLAASTELQVCAIARDGTFGTSISNTTTGLSNFTTERVTTPTTVRTIHGRYKIGVGTTAVSYVGTIGSARTHNEAVVTYKEAAGGADATVTVLTPATGLGRGELPTPVLEVTAGAVALADAPAPTPGTGQPRPFINLTVGA